MGRRRARTEQARGHLDQSVSGTAWVGHSICCSPPHRAGRDTSAPASWLPAKDVTCFPFFFFSPFYWCTNTSGAEVCCRHRGSVSGAQRPAAWTPQRAVLALLLINMLELPELIKHLFGTAPGTVRPSFLLTPFYCMIDWVKYSYAEIFLLSFFYALSVPPL